MVDYTGIGHGFERRAACRPKTSHTKLLKVTCDEQQHILVLLVLQIKRVLASFTYMRYYLRFPLYNLKDNSKLLPVYDL